jgi:enamine deaminase RidA (YjgF/YER057c/UK114 family)
MMADISRWSEFNKHYVTYFDPERMPARSAFGANGLALGAQVEMECWAYARRS